LPTLTAQQKKILIISSNAFGFLGCMLCHKPLFKPQMEGSFNDDWGLDGPGKIKYFNGKVEEGDFKNSLLHGPGKVSHPDGSKAEGEFENGFVKWARGDDRRPGNPL